MAEHESTLVHPWEFCHVEVAEGIRAGLIEMLYTAFGEKTEDIQVELTPPHLAPAEAQFLRTSSLGQGTISFFGSKDKISFKVPWPHEGIFLFRSDHTWCVDRWRWHPRLIYTPGVHFLVNFARQGLRAAAVAGRNHIVISKARFASAGSNISVEESDTGTRDPIHVAAGVRQTRPNPVYLPPSARRELIGMGLLPERAPSIVDWVDIERRFRKWCSTSLVERARGSDAQDICLQRLFTYNVFVKESVLEVLAPLVWKLRGATAAEAGTPLGLEEVRRYWETLARVSSASAWIRVQPLMDEGLLVRFEPLNGIDAISGLTGFQRYDKPSAQVEQMAPWRRQNHPSFKGLVCPVESPETKKVGITLHLASGCRVTPTGRLNPKDATDNVSGADGLGYAASMVPFAQHNDGARCMMGAKNLKQALPIRGSEDPLVPTGIEGLVQSQILRALQVQSVISAEQASTTPGVNLLVAYLPWYGWNADDAIVVNERLQEVLSWEYL
ncbi:MAG: hypothetical protein WCK63_18640, partial [Betaproteobacteria bacterium]